MMWKCDDCGKLVEKLGTCITHSGELCLDDSCPECGGLMLKAEKCAVCDKYEYAEELINGVCEECISKSINLSNILCFVGSKKLKVEWRMCLEEFVEEHQQEYAEWLKEFL